ncbi:MAG: alpha-1,3-galactosidase B [Akkermansiaceae bacterium]|nr:alpha-1,3-galactosidase B [Akkermansiaceae bacterium]
MMIPAKPLFVTSAIVSTVALAPICAMELNASDYGVHPGGKDCGAAVRLLINDARAKGASRINFAPGEYHFHRSSAQPMQMFISNHDQQAVHPVALPLVGLKNVEICGNGAKFIFHGMMLPVVLMDSEHVTVNDISIDFAEPFSAEGRIIEMKDGHTTLQMSQASRYTVENGKFLLTNNGRKDNIHCILAFEQDGRMVPTGRSGDMAWYAKAEKLTGNRVRFAEDAAAKGLSVGQTLVLRSYFRPHPGMLLYRAKDTTLNNVVFHDSQGMALIAQRSENITIRGGGCLRAAGRMHTTAADATHFSNCRGHISVQGATYEAMMDDAINVHATCLGITKVQNPRTFIARYMHGQAYGFEVMAPGEKLNFIHGPTLEVDEKQIEVDSVEIIDPRHVRVTLAEDLPDGIGEGDAIENADWHPSVDFSHNLIRHNRARGALFTTPEPVRVIGNHFDHTHGSAILLAGDAQGWYESGACKDVLIKGNTFRHGLTALYQFTDALISICPEVRQPGNQKQRYHTNVRIVDNEFITHRVPLLSAISADDVTFSGNTIERNDIYPAIKGGVPYNIRHSGSDFELQPVE